nr:uncharacterized protein CTRU02_14185 [Colletotrichum truncatum]KAF6782538.1 hypothetical protein CTRU02_14185 [Colletotrichum truncatum]
MASRANSKMIRKTTEQLDGRLRVQQLKPAGSSAPRITSRQATEFENEEDSDKEPEYQHDPLTEQQILRLTSN